MFASNISGKTRTVFSYALFLRPMDAETGLSISVKSKLNKLAWIVSAASLFVMFCACEWQATENVNSSTDRLNSQSSTQPMRIVTDDLGRRITIPTNIQRAISLAPSVTESIFAVGAGDRLVGDTTYCDYPEEAKAIQKVGDTLNPNLETIVSLKPDIVFVSGASQLETFTKTLDQNAIAVYVMNPLDLDAVVNDLWQLGVIFGTEHKSGNLVSELKDRERKIRETLATFHAEDEQPGSYDERVGTLKVFVQISKEPLFTIGKSAFLNNLLDSAGGRSVTEDVPSAFPKLSKETALSLQPQAIILSESPDNQEPNEVFKDSPAVKNGRVYKINADILSRPGPRLIDALEQIAKDLHPEKFK